MKCTPPFRQVVAPLLALAILALPPLAQEVVREAPRYTVENSSTHPALSQPEYPDVHKESLFITVEDGTRLAADIFRPAVGRDP